MDISTTPANRIKVLSVNSEATSFAALQETASDPLAAGTLNVAGKNSVIVWPFGTAAENLTFDIRLVGWWKGNVSWGYSILFEGSCTTSTEVGVASGDVLDTDYYCDTIGYTGGVATYSIGNSGANLPSLIRVDTLGASRLTFDFDLTGAASCNAIYASI